MCVYVYIYIYIGLTLSLYIYIYIYLRMLCDLLNGRQVELRNLIAESNVAPPSRNLHRGCKKRNRSHTHKHTGRVERSSGQYTHHRNKLTDNTHKINKGV